MARIKNNILGNLSGKVGDLIYKRTKSGGFVYLNRRVRQKSDSEKSIANNNDFKLANKFASVLNSSILLKRTWGSFRNIKGNRPYDKMHSFNSAFCHADFISREAYIIPEGINSEITNFFHDDNNAVFHFKAYDDFHDIYSDPLSVVALIYLNMPVSDRIGRKLLPQNAYILLEEDFDRLNIKDDLTAVISFENYDGEFKEIEYYKRVRTYISIFFNDKQNKVKWTKSASYLFKGHDIDNEYYDPITARLRQEREEAKNPKPQPKYRRIIKK